MLTYLIPSAARRKLLVALWRDRERGTASYLARYTNSTFANAYRELKAMNRAGLARRVLEGGREVYEADESLSQARALRALVDADPRKEPKTAGSAPASSTARFAQDTRLWLRDLGAPLAVEGKPSRAPTSVEQALVAATELAHRDATVARALPVCFWLNRDKINGVRLEREASLRREKHSVGFFLALTAALGNDASMRKQAERFRDRRVRRMRDFFPASSAGYSLKLAERRTPKLARKWCFRMNMTMDSFASLFGKFVSDAHLCR